MWALQGSATCPSWADNNLGTPVLKENGLEEPPSVQSSLKSVQPLPHRCCFHSDGGSIALPVSLTALGRNRGPGTGCVIRDDYFGSKSFVHSLAVGLLTLMCLIFRTIWDLGNLVLAPQFCRRGNGEPGRPTMCQQVQNLVKEWEEEALQKIACTRLMQAICPACAGALASPRCTGCQGRGKHFPRT